MFNNHATRIRTGLWMVVLALHMFSARRCFGESELSVQPADLANHLKSPRPHEVAVGLVILAKINTPEAATLALQTIRASRGVRVEPSVTQLLTKLPEKDILDEFQSKTSVCSEEMGAVITRWPAAKIAESLDPLITTDDPLLRQRIDRVISAATSRNDLALKAIFLKALKLSQGNSREQLIRNAFASNLMTEELAGELFKDPDRAVRNALFSGFNWDKSKSAAWELHFLQPLTTSPDVQTRESANEIIFHRRYNEAEYAPLASEIAEKCLYDNSPRLRCSGVFYYFSETPDAGVLERIVTLLTDSDHNVARDAIECLEKHHHPKLVDLAAGAAAWSSPGAKIRALNVLKDASDRRLNVLVEKLSQDPSREVRDAAEKFQIQPDIGFVLRQVSRDEWAKMDESQHLVTIQRLSFLNLEVRMAQLETLYKELNENQRPQMLFVCGKISNKEEVEPFVVEKLKEKDPAVRAAALKALDNSPACVLPALEMINDENGEISSLALSVLGSQNSEYLCEINNQFYRAHPNKRMTRFNFDAATQKQNLLDALPTAVHYQLRDEWRQYGGYAWDDPELRAGMLQRLDKLDYVPSGVPTDPVAIAELCKNIDESNPRRCTRIIKLLCQCDSAEARQTVKNFTTSKNTEIRWATLQALGAQGDLSPEVVDFLLARLLTTQKQSRYLWPQPVSFSLERLKTFEGLADPTAIREVQEELEARIQNIKNREGQP